MGFLKNNQDIILDAVLTDAGRKILSKGDGSFQVVKFALGDDEIDYGLYDKTNPQGSIYYDLKIISTPVFEAFTNSSAGLRSKIISLVDDNLLYLPILKLNQSSTQLSPVTTIDSNTQAFNLITNDNFATYISSYASSEALLDGRINLPSNTSNITANTTTSAAFRASELTKRFLKVSQGFDNPLTNISLKNNGTGDNPDLEEVTFNIYVNRLFLSVGDKNLDTNVLRPVFSTNVFKRTQAADVYKVGFPLNSTFFGDVEQYNDGNQTKLLTSLNASSIEQVGKELQFSLKISSILASNPSYYFTTFGQAVSAGSIISGKTVSGGDNIYVISTFVRVEGANYGYGLDIPINLYYKA